MLSNGLLVRYPTIPESIDPSEELVPGLPSTLR